MLFGEDGSRAGILSGGCLEEELAERVKDILESGAGRCFVYNLTEDEAGWFLASGCGGIIHVMLEPVDHQLRNHLFTLKRYLDQGVPVVLAKKIEDDGSVLEYAYMADDILFGAWETTNFPSVVKALYAGGLLLKRKSGIRFSPELSSTVFVHRCEPKPRLMIFGAGEDARPLASLAAQTGFSVTLSDWRPAFLTRNHFPFADQLLLGFPNEICEQLSLTPADFVVMMTHHFDRDKELLDRLLKRELRYLGLLGSHERSYRLLEGITPPSWFHSPVGLPIAADGPEEIAVSIMAEIIHTLRSRPEEGLST